MKMACNARLAGGLALLPLPLAGESLPRTGSGGRGEGDPLKQNAPMRKAFNSKGYWPRPVGMDAPSPPPSPASGRGSKTRSDAPCLNLRCIENSPSATINCPPDGPYRPFSCHKPRLAGSLVFASRLDWRWHMVKTRNKQTPSAPSAVTPAKAEVHNSAPSLSNAPTGLRLSPQ